ncbi:MAG TPA: hypothetical protein PKX91_04315 [Clostridia bacterium]|jgi:cell fate (sporulation/competence/biofilm development) regulator YlbF (YheA/YmcA/DUF963 family)|nr:hypothetical protein [Clostridia bacterium]
MNNLILAIPAELPPELWWTYPLALVAVIVICAVLLVILKRIRPDKEANKLVKKAIRYLKRAVTGKLRAGFNIITAKNLIKSAAYYYSGIMKEKEIYKFRVKIEVLESALEELNSLVGENGDMAHIEQNLPSIVNKLSAIVD